MTGPRLRQDLAQLPAYTPGRPAVTGTSGLGPGHKLSSNENPYPPLPSVLQAVAEQSAAFNRYPDMSATHLTAALASRFDVPVDDIAVGAGSVGVLGQILAAVVAPGDEVVYAWRSFEAYPILVQVAGATPVPVPLTPDERHDLGAMAAAVTDRTRLVLVCSPNNPTGTAVRRAEFEQFLDRIPDDVLVVIDEAYHEFVTDPDVPDGLDLYRGRSNVAVLRTFSKAYGLAGLRVGYLIAHSPVAAAVRRTAPPFAVTALAQAAAIASLSARDELHDRVDALNQGRTRVEAALTGQGWALVPSQANFVWLRTGRDSAAFTAACAANGVTVRPYGDEGVRVSIGTPDADDAFLATAAAWRAQACCHWVLVSGYVVAIEYGTSYRVVNARGQVRSTLQANQTFDMLADSRDLGALLEALLRETPAASPPESLIAKAGSSASIAAPGPGGSGPLSGEPDRPPTSQHQVADRQFYWAG